MSTQQTTPIINLSYSGVQAMEVMNLALQAMNVAAIASVALAVLQSLGVGIPELVEAAGTRSLTPIKEGVKRTIDLNRYKSPNTTVRAQEYDYYDDRNNTYYTSSRTTTPRLRSRY